MPGSSQRSAEIAEDSDPVIAGIVAPNRSGSARTPANISSSSRGYAADRRYLNDPKLTITCDPIGSVRKIVPWDPAEIKLGAAW